MFSMVVVGVLGWLLIAVLMGGLCALAAEGDRAVFLPEVGPAPEPVGRPVLVMEAPAPRRLARTPA
ncbi:MAG: hypothetical protein H0V81_09520 [Solirubrobacterales bacterium]|nr:hypothetical protein [Solirubrobacterales bacterium]